MTTVNIMDLALIETHDGGDLVLVGNDFGKVNGHENQCYIAMFGGNPGYSTPKLVVNGEQRFDYWANSLLFDQGNQANSLTEFTLQNTELSSQGRLKILSAVQTDLLFLQGVATYTVEVTIPAINTVLISVRTIYNTGEKLLTTFVYRKFLSPRDFSTLDFSTEDFF